MILVMATGSIFFFNDTATTEIYTLSLHDALPIFPGAPVGEAVVQRDDQGVEEHRLEGVQRGRVAAGRGRQVPRSEEHTSELQSRQYLVCRLLLEKKKKDSRKDLAMISTLSLQPTT